MIYWGWCLWPRDDVSSCLYVLPFGSSLKVLYLQPFVLLSCFFFFFGWNRIFCLKRRKSRVYNRYQTFWKQRLLIIIIIFMVWKRNLFIKKFNTKINFSNVSKCNSPMSHASIKFISTGYLSVQKHTVRSSVQFVGSSGLNSYLG